MHRGAGRQAGSISCERDSIAHGSSAPSRQRAGHAHRRQHHRGTHRGIHTQVFRSHEPTASALRCPHLGLQQQCACDGQPLLLAARQRMPPLPHLSLIPIGQLPHKLISVCCLGRRQNLLGAGAGLAVAAGAVRTVCGAQAAVREGMVRGGGRGGLAGSMRQAEGCRGHTQLAALAACQSAQQQTRRPPDLVHHAARHQHRLLQHRRHAHRRRGAAAARLRLQRLAIHQDAAPLRVVQPQQQSCNGGLAAAAGPHQRDCLAGQQREAEPPDGPALGPGVAEPDIPQLHPPAAAGLRCRCRCCCYYPCC